MHLFSPLRHNSSLVCMVEITYVYIDTVFGFYGYFFLNHLYCLVGCLSMIVWTHAVLGVLYACVLYFCICTCSVQLSMFHMERCSRNMLIIIITITITTVVISIKYRKPCVPKQSPVSVIFKFNKNRKESSTTSPASLP